MNDSGTQRTDRGGRVEVSVVVPAYNEEDNIAPLLDQFGELARRARFSLEVVLVDDGSNDRTLPRAADAQNKHRFLKIVTLPYRRGLTEALRAGFAVSRGEVIVFYPADRQFHPADIPRMVEKVRSGYDLVTGRKIGQYSKRIVSGFYNRLSRILFPSIQVSDLNSVKAFRRELVEVFDYRHDWHRFWVAIVSEAGYRVGEVDVTLYERASGRSKFGVWRIPGAVLDLLAVKFQYHTMRRPLWYFGLTGMAMLAVAFLIGLVALYQRFMLGTGNRSLVFLVMTLGLSGVVLFAIGFVAESVAGIRQQVEAMRTSPKYQTYRPRPKDRSSDRPTSRNTRDDRSQARSPRRGERPARRRPTERRGSSSSEPRKPREVVKPEGKTDIKPDVEPTTAPESSTPKGRSQATLDFPGATPSPIAREAKPEQARSRRQGDRPSDSDSVSSPNDGAPSGDPSSHASPSGPPETPPEDTPAPPSQGRSYGRRGRR